MQTRVSKLTNLLNQHHLDAIVLNPGPSLIYLTGLQFHLMERPTVAIFTVEGKAALVLPILEQQKLTGLPFQPEVFSFGDDPATWQAAFTRALAALGLHKGKVGVETTRLRVLELRFLEAAGKDLQFVDGSPVLEALRMVKDEGEIQKMREAALIAQHALVETLKAIRVGMTEKQIAAELMVQLYRADSDGELPFQPIVSTGPNTANPHAVPSERALQEGDLLLFDWGASRDGYFSDITRTFTAGQIDPEFLRIGDIVLAANARGHGTARAGMPTGKVDQAVRAVIETAGYGACFTHRTGHGLGMEAHEAPYIFGENNLILEPGMTFTVEPGIYLPGRGGVRIEDDVVVTQEGVRSLTDLPRQVLPLETFKA
ncbi:MAG: Xaa-Pro peptidase family protein [Anaerolineaceae bacterium]